MNIDQQRQFEIDRYAKAYQRARYRMGDRRQRDGKRILAGIEPKGSLLDVGAGRGEGLKLARDVGHGPLTGIEPVPYLASDKIMEGIATDLPFSDGSFDTVMCLDVLEHLIAEDVRPALEEMNRVARNHIFLTAAENSHFVRGLGEMHISKRPADDWAELFESVFTDAAEIEFLGQIGVSPGWLVRF